MLPSSTHMGRFARLVAVLTLAAPVGALAGDSVCNTVQVEVRPTNLLGDVDFKSPPAKVLPTKFCFIVYDKGTGARFSLEFLVPNQKPYTSWQLGRIESEVKSERNETSGLDFQRFSANYNEDRMVGLSESMWVRTYEDGSTIVGGFVSHLELHRVLTWKIVVDADGNRIDSAGGHGSAKPRNVKEAASSKSIPL